MVGGCNHFPNEPQAIWLQIFHPEFTLEIFNRQKESCRLRTFNANICWRVYAQYPKIIVPMSTLWRYFFHCTIKYQQTVDWKFLFKILQSGFSWLAHNFLKCIWIVCVSMIQNWKDKKPWPAWRVNIWCIIWDQRATRGSVSIRGGGISWDWEGKTWWDETHHG